MADAGVDVLIATDPNNVAHMSDYLCTSHRVTPGVQVYGILPRDKNIPLGLVIPSLEVDSWAEQPGAISDVSVYGTVHRDRATSSALPQDDQLIFDYAMARDTFRDAIEALQSALERRGLDDAVVGLDESNVQAPMWPVITGAFPRAKVVPAASLFRQIRLIKTAAEIERMARSAEITELAIREISGRKRARASPSASWPRGSKRGWQKWTLIPASGSSAPGAAPRTRMRGSRTIACEIVI